MGELSTSTQSLPKARDGGHAGELRANALLRAASLLLASGEQLGAVLLLHSEIHRELAPADPFPHASYASDSAAREEHRRLSSELGRQRARLQSGRGWQKRWQRFVLWATWAAAVGVVGGLVLRYAYALLNRTRWQHEHPAGVWISRYYRDPDFKELALSRYDVAINYDWGKGAPAEAMSRDEWSGTWDTCVVASTAVKLKLRLLADDGAKFIVDDVLQLWVRRRVTQSRTVELEPGVHHLRVVYQERRRVARLRLEGLNFEGTESYQFQRPRVEGDTIRCDAPGPQQGRP